jgi:hypothetical protein
MNMYEAMLATAAHIETRPHLYNFNVTNIPNGSENNGPVGFEATGCILGRLAQITGIRVAHADMATGPLLGMPSSEFFNRLQRMMGELHLTLDLHAVSSVVPALRRYAELHRIDLEAREYPIPAIPAAVRKIFAMPAPVPYDSYQVYDINTDSMRLVKFEAAAHVVSALSFAF